MPKTTIQAAIDLNTTYRTTYEKGHKLFEQFDGWTLTPVAFVRGGAFVNCNATKGEGGMAERRCFADVPVGALVRAKY